MTFAGCAYPESALAVRRARGDLLNGDDLGRPEAVQGFATDEKMC